MTDDPHEARDVDTTVEPVVITEPIHPWRWRLLTVWVVAFTLLVAYSLNVTRDQVDKNVQTHTVLCTYRTNLQDQVDASRQYSNDVATGVRKPIPGISNADIVASIRRQQSALDALRDLNCDDVTPTPASSDSP